MVKTLYSLTYTIHQKVCNSKHFLLGAAFFYDFLLNRLRQFDVVARLHGILSTALRAAAKVVHEWLFVQIFFGWNGGVLNGMVVFGLYWGL